MKRRIHSLFLMLVMLSALMGCNTQPDDPEEDWRYAFSHKGALSEQGYYYLNQEEYLHYTDLATGKDIILCSFAGCSHSDRNCDAFMLATDKDLFFHQDHLYYINLEDNALCQRNTLGTEEVTVGVPGKALLEKGYSVSLSRSVPAGSYLYYYGSVIKTAAYVDKKGTLTATNGFCIGRIHLTTGADEILFEQEITDGWSGQSLELCAARDGSILFLQCDGAKVSHEDENYTEASKNMPMSLKCWDAATGETVTLLQRPRAEMLEVYLVADGIVYYGGMAVSGEPRPHVRSYDLNTGKETVVFEHSSMQALGGGHAYRSTGDGVYTVQNLQSGEALPCEIVPCVVHAQSAQGIVTQYTVKDPENDTVKEIVYGYVPYSAMADGIQKEDMQVFYTTKIGFGD